MSTAADLDERAIRKIMSVPLVKVMARAWVCTEAATESPPRSSPTGNSRCCACLWAALGTG